MKHFFLFYFVYWIGGFVAFAQPSSSRSVATVSGYVREKGSSEALIGVNVYLPGTTTGTVTNTYGFYSLTITVRDSLTLSFSFVGYESVQETLAFRKNTVLDIELTPGRLLSEVIVTGNRSEEKVSESSQMSKIDVPVAQIKKIPAFLGEKDVLKVLQLMPGVQKGSEGSTGIYVRGGGPDQNLIIVDDAIVYNANHLFGFFSVFNGDALKSVELIKGGFPARYGGRLSSVIEMNMKEGNKEKLHGEGGIGLIASRLTLEGPLTKKKSGAGSSGTRSSSFLVSARRTYLDFVARPLIKQQTDGQVVAGYYFYDLNAKANYDFGPKNKLYLSGYFGQDRFYVDDQETATKINLDWGNTTATLRWNHLFSQRLFSNLSLIFSNYKFQISSEEQDLQTADQFSLRYSSGIRDFSLKYDVDYYPSPRHSIRFGVQSIAHRFTPSAVVLQNTLINQFTTRIDAIDVVESGLYAEDNWRPNEHWRINAGIRLSHFIQKQVNYVRPEPRISAAYVIKPSLSVKASYALMNQYVHLLSNTGIGLPTDLWVPTTDQVKPQQSQQVAVGIAKDFADKGATRGLTLTVEGYYKAMNNIINYREGASFLLINSPESANQVRWEDNVTAGKGWSYGAEVLLQKKLGRFTGWTGYTLSWTQWQFPELNFGKKFYPRYDRRHDISVVGIYEINPRITLSGTWVYGTGNALTVPLAKYQAATHQVNPIVNNDNSFINQFFGYDRAVNDYSGKNSFRAEAYHRMDIGIQFHKKKRHHERTWEVSVYNLYNRRNPFFYQLNTVTNEQTNQPTRTVFQRYSVFPIVPSVTYGFKF